MYKLTTKRILSGWPFSYYKFLILQVFSEFWLYLSLLFVLFALFPAKHFGSPVLGVKCDKVDFMLQATFNFIIR